MRKKNSIRAKLFILFSIIFIVSMIFISYLASRIVTQFGEYSANENEVSIKTQASFFLSQVTQEKAMRCENIFERIAVSSSYLARQSAIALDLEPTIGKAPFRFPGTLTKAEGSSLYSNQPTDPVMVLYWGKNKPDKTISSHLNALSHVDPLLKTVIERNPESVACFITFELATTRYYPNFPSVIRTLSAQAFEIRNSAWYTAVKPENNPDRRTVWSEIYQDPAGRGLMTTAVSPVYNFKNEFIGAAGVDVTLVNITDKILSSTVMDPVTNTKDMFSFIVDTSGRIVAFPRKHLTLFGFDKLPEQKDLEYNALFNLRLSDSRNEDIRKLWTRETQQNAHSQERISVEGRQLLISSSIMPSTGWRLCVAVPESNLLESVFETRNALKSMVRTMVLKFGIFAVLIMIASIAGFAILSIKYFIHPLDLLIQAAIRVREGDLSHQVKIERQDELGLLGQTFNTMVLELQKLNLKEKEHAEHLQKKVKERTLELEEKTFQQKQILDQLEQEIRDRKQVELELIKSEEKYRDIFNNSVQGIFQSSKDNRLISANPSMARILGYHSIGEFLSSIHNLAEQVYVEPSQRKEFIDLLSDNDFVSGFETQLKKKDGSRVWVSICGRAIKDDSGNFSHIQGSFEDISERKHAQEIFKQAKRMAEEASRAKGEFLTIMSHEIRTPLNAIIGMTRLTQTTNLDPTQKEYLDAVLISSDHLLTLLNNILDFSKIEAGKFVLEKKAFDIDTLLNDMMAMFSFQAQNKNLHLHCTTGRFTRYVKGDINRLRQILVNLVGNAIKFTNTGSIAIHVDVAPDKDRSETDITLLFSIKDTGVGIPSDKLTAVFNDFTQVQSPHSSDPGGTGLGLAITRQLIHLMGGDISVESEDGKGSTFHFYIQLKKASKNEVTAVIGSSLDTFAPPKDCQLYAPQTILLAEDFEVNRKLLVPFLERYGHTVISAENGREVLSTLNRKSFDIILMDIKMPVMDGIEATKQIRAHADPKISNLPVIALTAHAIRGDKEKFLAMGMDDYVSKPIQGDELLKSIEHFAKIQKKRKPSIKKEATCDLDYALKLMGGNQDIVDELCKTIIIKFPQETGKIIDALSRKDFETLTMVAHSLKSGAKTIQANEMLDCVMQIEAAGKRKDGKKCKLLLGKLISSVENVVNCLREKQPNGACKE